MFRTEDTRKSIPVEKIDGRPTILCEFCFEKSEGIPVTTTVSALIDTGAQFCVFPSRVWHYYHDSIEWVEDEDLAEVLKAHGIPPNLQNLENVQRVGGFGGVRLRARLGYVTLNFGKFEFKRCLAKFSLDDKAEVPDLDESGACKKDKHGRDIKHNDIPVTIIGLQSLSGGGLCLDLGTDGQIHLVGPI